MHRGAHVINIHDNTDDSPDNREVQITQVQLYSLTFSNHNITCLLTFVIPLLFTLEQAPENCKFKN